jgi:phospholipase C
MLRNLKLLLLAAAALVPIAAQAATLNDITNIVVIFAENRSFDNLYGNFPGANGLAQATAPVQVDRDGSPLKELPATWGGVTIAGVNPPVTQMQSEHLPNKPFAMDGNDSYKLGLDVVHRDLWHRFYQEQMQIDGGKNDKFAAWADSGGLVMGHYDGSTLPLWSVARKYVLADDFFQGAFGGSFLNHFELICACAPKYPNAATSPAKPTVSAVGEDGVTLVTAADSPRSSIDGPPKFVSDGNITPDGYAVNTMQPPYQPSANKPAAGGDPTYADPMLPNTLPPQTDVTIGDLLSQKGITWAWYAGAWQATLDGKNATPVPNFQFHHQPFNYFVNYAPGTQARADHLKDGGLGGTEFIKAIDAGTLPQVAFYKPQGNLNEHGGYTDVTSGDQHLADVIAHLEKSPQFAHMVVLVTFDENGGFWDHVAPPKADRFGPGNRVPAIIVSPYAKKGTVDHTQYDTTSVLRLITKRYQLPVLAGITARDQALVANGKPVMGDLTAALDLQ